MQKEARVFTGSSGSNINASMLNWHKHSHRALLHLKTSAPRSQHQHHPLIKFCSTISDSFTVSYLITRFGFSPETALSISRKFRLDSPHRPDSVLAFLATHGFSPFQIRQVIQGQHTILLCDPNNLILPKFQFLRSKGASTSHIIRIATASPTFLSRSLDSHIVPAYQFLRTFLVSDELIIRCLSRDSSVFFSDDPRFPLTAEFLLDNGFTRSAVARLLHMCPSVLCSRDLPDTVHALKQLGFDTSAPNFSAALVAKSTVNKTNWGESVRVFKKWGWSQEHVLMAFKKHPSCMLTEPDEIDAVFSYWVKELGGSSLELVKYPVIFRLSLKKWIAPRASVVRFLAAQGLLERSGNMVALFIMSEKRFLDTFVKRYEKHSSQLLKMYKESVNMNVANSKENKKKTCL
ncbi:hypothetical protein JHK82_019786 [Glycine max]|nr:hypothetical protein JHK82_019786 [Glycine max]